jgi:hypothetical protein
MHHVDKSKFVKIMNKFVNMTNLQYDLGYEADESIFVI